MQTSLLDLIVRRFLLGQNVSFGLSLILFTFMFLPMFVVLLAVIVFFGLCYLQLRKSCVLNAKVDQPRRSVMKDSMDYEH